MSIQALREQKQALSKELNHQLAENGAKVWTAEDKKSFDAKADQIEALDAQIASTQRILDMNAEKDFKNVPLLDPKDKGAVKVRDLFAKMLRHGERSLSNEELLQIRNTMSTTTTTQGGYTVESGVAKELIDNLKGYKGMRDVAQSITTANGAPLSYPTSDGRSETGEIVAENTTAAAADPVFGTVALNTVKFGSKSIAVPIELLQDASIDIVAMINQRVVDRVGRIQNSTFTTGTTGLFSVASTGKTGTTGQTLTVIYDDLVDLVDSVDYAYAVNPMKWMFNQTTRKVLRKIKDTAGRPIWTPGYELGMTAGTPDSLLGYDVVINNDVAVPAANAKTIAFGDLSKYMIRDAMELTMFRFEDSAFMLKGQVGFVAWARAGGNLLDTAAVSLYAHSAT
jgi:HK97 family phage major capsid protein